MSKKQLYWSCLLIELVVTDMDNSQKLPVTLSVWLIFNILALKVLRHMFDNAKRVALFLICAVIRTGLGSKYESQCFSWLPQHEWGLKMPYIVEHSLEKQESSFSFYLNIMIPFAFLQLTISFWSQTPTSLDWEILVCAGKRNVHRMKNLLEVSETT